MKAPQALLYCLLIASLLFVGTGQDASAQARTKSTEPSSRIDISRFDARSDQGAYQFGRTLDVDKLVQMYARIAKHRAAATELQHDNHHGARASVGAILNHDMHAVPAPVDGMQYAYPAVAVAANGDLVMAFKDWGVFPNFWDGPPTDPAKVYVVRSSDGGATWSDAAKIAEGDFPLDFNFLEMTALGSGRLLLNDLTPFEDDHYFYSDDNGQTWIPASIEPLWNPDWHGPIEGNVWYTHTTDEGEGSVVYRTSADGMTWSQDKVLYTNPNSTQYRVTASAVASAGGTNVVAIIQRLDLNTYESSSLLLRSSNGGSTWSAPSTLASGGMDLNVTAIERAPDGTLWMTAQGSPPWNGPPSNPFEYNSNIYYLTSADGASWSAPTAFTSYLGEDYLADLAFVSGSPFIPFTSDRVKPGGVFYGIGGVTVDSGPPTVANWVFPWGGVAPGATAEVVVAAASAAGIASVDMVVSVDGVESVVAFTNGGESCQEYNLDPEYCWTGEVGPFDLGPEVRITAVATDNDGRTGASYSDQVNVLATHSAGNVEMSIQRNGFIGSLIWPAGGDNYMCCGGPWAGANVDGGIVITEGGWLQKPGFVVTSGPGQSDQDIVVSYTDGGALGLEVVQRSYQWSDEALKDGLVIEYEYTNTGAVGDLSELFAAVHLDADFVNGDLFWDDRIAYSANTDVDVIYMYDSGVLCIQSGVPCPEGYLGLAVLRDASGSTGSTLVPRTATTNKFDKEPWSLIREGINPDLAGRVPYDDHRMLITAQPFALPSGASETITFALVMGASRNEMLDNVRAIAAAYDARVTGIEHEVSGEIPSEFSLEQNYPNPFNPATTFTFSLPRAAHATLTVYDLLGKEVASLVSGDLQAGVHQVSWDASEMASGMYLYRVTAGDFTQVRKMMLVK